jgi:hypothetical protein
VLFSRWTAANEWKTPINGNIRALGGEMVATEEARRKGRRQRNLDGYGNGDTAIEGTGARREALPSRCPFSPRLMTPAGWRIRTVPVRLSRLRRPSPLCLILELCLSSSSPAPGRFQPAASVLGNASRLVRIGLSLEGQHSPIRSPLAATPSELRARRDMVNGWGQ